MRARVPSRTRVITDRALLMEGWRYLRRRGLVGTVRALFTRFVYGSRAVVVYRTTLAGPSVPDRIGDVVFRLAMPADLDRLHEFADERRGEIHRRAVTEDGDWLFVACHADRIVATRRYSRRLSRAGLMSRVLTLGPQQVWSADAFCLPEYRNRGLNGHFGLFTIRYLASLGYTEEFGEIVASNVASLRSVRNRGGQFPYFVSFRRMLFRDRLDVSTTLPREVTAALHNASDARI